MITLPPRAELERAYLEGDSTYDGVFFLGVRTTGIFCRPTCPARKPLPKNVAFFPTAAAALAAGYRPCKRCRPQEIDAQPAWATELLKELERNPAVRITEAELRGRGLDPATVRRHFQRTYGVTFQAFARARRMAGALEKIRAGGKLDNLVYAYQYSSHSGFHNAYSRNFGTSPAKSRDRDYIFTTFLRSPLGPLVAGATEAGLCLLEFTDRRGVETQLATLERRLAAPLVLGEHAHLRSIRDELTAYFAGELQQFHTPLHFPGSPFQQQVWRELLEIPFGETRSYEALARKVGKPAAARAVGRANGQNRLAIVIPCHRVVNKDGQLGGYGGGLRRKQYLLNLERAAAASTPSAAD